MDDPRDPRDDEKERLGLVATVLRRSKYPTQVAFANVLQVDPRRVSEIETGELATAELLQEVAGRLGFNTVHVFKVMDLVEFLREEQRRPFDPIGLTPSQEVSLHQLCREMGAELDAMFRGRIRRLNLEDALRNAAGQWEQIKDLATSRWQAEVRGNAGFHTWGFCLFLCEESVRRAADDPKIAVEVGRLAVTAARLCTDILWVGRLGAYALAHLANAYRVLGRHEKADKLFAQANRLWNSPDAAKADPGVLDPGRIHHLEAAFRKDQRKLPQALALLDQAFKLGRDRGRVLIHRAIVLSLKGSYEEAIETLRHADLLLEEREPRDDFNLSINTGVNLCHLNRFNEAAGFSDVALRIAESRIDILRGRWLRARVLAGKGDRLDAVSIYRNLINEFDKLNMTYDLALVTLEFAAVLLALGQTRECRSLTTGLPSYFEAKGIHQEALAALKLFSDSVHLETATEVLARQVAAFLYLAESDRDLRFVPVRS